MTRSASAAGGPQVHTSAQRTLLSLLELACGAAEPAHEAVRLALVMAGRDELPLTGPEIVAFVRAHLMTLLSDQIGPRLTMALIDDLVEKLEGGGDAEASGEAQSSTPPPASIPRPIARLRPRPGSSPRVKPQAAVLLVDADRVARSAVARALLRAKWDVTAVDTAAELDSALQSGESIDLLLIDGNHPEAEAMLEAILSDRPSVGVVIRSGDASRSRALLTALGAERYEVRSHDAPTEELLEAAKRTVGSG